jgi:threonine/homoserine/homoserine lactone efflux protein
MSFLAVSVVALVFAFVGSLPLAGPIALLVVSNGVDGRYREAFKIALGAALAEGVYAFLAFFGFATLLARYQLVLPISQGVTAVLLGGLGARFIFFKVERGTSREDRPQRAPFWVGLSISALNPTLLLTWSAVTTFLYSKQIVEFAPLLAVPFGAFAALGVALWGGMTVALLRRYGRHVPDVVLTWVVRAMGVVLICAGVWSGVALAKHLVRRAEGPPARVAFEVAAAKSICMPPANTWSILRIDEGAPRSPGSRVHGRRRVRGGRHAGSAERG